MQTETYINKITWKNCNKTNFLRLKEDPSSAGLDNGICTLTNIRHSEEGKKLQADVLSLHINHQSCLL